MPFPVAGGEDFQLANKVVLAPGGGKLTSSVEVVALRPVLARVGLEGVEGLAAKVHHAVPPGCRTSSSGSSRSERLALKRLA
jgi:hypothetical protein